MKRKELEERVAGLVDQILAGENMELVDVEFMKEGQDYFLRIYLDKPGGITINDCETVSRQLDVKLDENDWIEEHYYLEVSSPGLDRPLKKPADFQRYKGERVEIKLYRPLDGEKLYEGVLIGKEGKEITIETDNHQQMVFDESQVALVKRAITF